MLFEFMQNYTLKVLSYVLYICSSSLFQFLNLQLFVVLLFTFLYGILVINASCFFIYYHFFALCFCWSAAYLDIPEWAALCFHLFLQIDTNTYEWFKVDCWEAQLRPAHTFLLIFSDLPIHFQMGFSNIRKNILEFSWQTTTKKHS